MTGRRYIDDAIETYEGLRRDLLGRYLAHSRITQEDIDAIERAKQAVETARSLYEDYEGLLDPEHDHVRDWPDEDDD